MAIESFGSEHALVVEPGQQSSKAVMSGPGSPRSDELLEAQQHLRAAVGHGAQERHEADQGCRPPIGQAAERIARRGLPGMDMEQHGKSLWYRENTARIWLKNMPYNTDIQGNSRST